MKSNSSKQNNTTSEANLSDVSGFQKEESKYPQNSKSLEELQKMAKDILSRLDDEDA